MSDSYARLLCGHCGLCVFKRPAPTRSSGSRKLLLAQEVDSPEENPPPSTAMKSLLSAAAFLLASTSLNAQTTAFNAASYDSAMLSEFAWRPIGPAVTSGR